MNLWYHKQSSSYVLLPMVPIPIDGSEWGGGLSLEVDGWGDMGFESSRLIVHEVPELEAE